VNEATERRRRLAFALLDAPTLTTEAYRLAAAQILRAANATSPRRRIGAVVAPLSDTERNASIHLCRLWTIVYRRRHTVL